MLFPSLKEKMFYSNHFVLVDAWYGVISTFPLCSELSTWFGRLDFAKCFPLYYYFDECCTALWIINHQTKAIVSLAQNFFSNWMNSQSIKVWIFKAYSGKLTSSTISFGEVSTLDHEVLDDSVEFASLVTKSFLCNLNKHRKHTEHLKQTKRDIS